MSVPGRRKCDSEVKRNTVRLSVEAVRRIPEVAENLAVGSALIYRWRQQELENSELAFPGNGNMALTHEQKRIRELEKQLKDTAMERDILKKAMSIFRRTSK